MATTTIKEIGEKLIPPQGFHKNMTPRQLVKAWQALPAWVQALLPEVSAAIAVLAGLIALYDTIVKLYKLAVKAYAIAQKVVLITALPPNPGTATAITAKETNKALNDAKAQAVQAAKKAVLDKIMNYPIHVPGT